MEKEAGEVRWTKGPWRFAGGASSSVTNAEGDCIATTGFTGFPVEERHANARLIAAAPELYEALKAWVDHLDGPVDAPTNTLAHERKLMAASRAILSKATT
jgi:hypothetical protein